MTIEEAVALKRDDPSKRFDDFTLAMAISSYQLVVNKLGCTHEAGLSAGLAVEEHFKHYGLDRWGPVFFTYGILLGEDKYLSEVIGIVVEDSLGWERGSIEKTLERKEVNE